MDRGEVAHAQEFSLSWHRSIVPPPENEREIRGDLGLTCGLIATNATELERLQTTGKREYYPVRLSSAPQTVRDITFELAKIEPTENRFDLLIRTNEGRLLQLTKTPRFVFEPIQFFIASARDPYELVIYEADRDGLRGYLSVPKRGEDRECVWPPLTSPTSPATPGGSIDSEIDGIAKGPTIPFRRQTQPPRYRAA
jgi:hypothetical protein